MTALQLKMTVDEFLAWEETQEERYELYDGEAFSMAGGTFRHGNLNGNTYLALRNALRTQKYNVIQEVIKVIVGPYAFYPDILVVCQAKINPTDRIAKEPELIVEILSSSTEQTDKTIKWRDYQTLPSLHTYLMIAQEQISVECYEREQDGWHYVHLTKRDDELRLQHTEITLKLADIYEGIDFDSPS